VRHKAAYGFKLHTKLHGDQLIHTDHFLTTVAQQGWKIIHLQRARLFNQIISGFLANQTGRYFGGQQPPEAPVQLTFPVTDFVKRVEQSDAIRRQQQTLLATIPHLSLIYEQDLADQANWVQTVARICDYLAIPATSAVTSTVQKPWQRAHAELIVNYAELERVYQQYERLPTQEQ
jgi:LPS sulfotransferase NodH